MASNIEELFDVLYEMIDNARNMPLSGDKCIIERDKALDLLDNIRTQFPVELKKARDLVVSRDDYIMAAKREAEGIRQSAEAEAKRILNQDSITLQAKQQADEIIARAEEKGRVIVNQASGYCDEMMRRLDEDVARIYEDIRQTRVDFRNMLGGGGGNMRGGYDIDPDYD